MQNTPWRCTLFEIETNISAQFTAHSAKTSFQVSELSRIVHNIDNIWNVKYMFYEQIILDIYSESIFTMTKLLAYNHIGELSYFSDDRNFLRDVWRMLWGNIRPICDESGEFILAWRLPFLFRLSYTTYQLLLFQRKPFVMSHGLRKVTMIS